MLKIDKLTFIQDRGRFARICVELDLDKQLSLHFIVNAVKLPLEYEGLHFICFKCGRYGHKKDQSRNILEVPEDALVTGNRKFPTMVKIGNGSGEGIGGARVIQRDPREEIARFHESV